MNLLRAFVTHEIRLQARSLRTRLVVAAWLLGALALPLWAAFGASAAETVSSSVQALLVHLGLPLLSFVCSAALAVDGITRERDENSLAVLGVAPVTNAGYVLRRWLALCVPCVALSAIPPIVAALLAAWRGGSPVVVGRFAWPWLLHAAPAAVLGSAMGLAFGTFAGGTILAVVQALLVSLLVLSIGNDLLAHSGRTIDGPGTWLGLRDTVESIEFLVRARSLEGVSGSDAPVDVRSETSQSLGGITFLAVLASASLGLSLAFLRRSQPDVRPWRIRPDHPLRGFLAWLNRMRLSGRPDPDLTRLDALAIGVALALAALVAANGIARYDAYAALGDHRRRIEGSGGPEPTPLGFVTTQWSATGRLERDGEWQGRFEIALRNDDAAPQPRLACSLGTGVEILELAASDRTVAWTHPWDRVNITFTPPVPPGASVRVTGRVGGRAVSHVFALGWVGRGFAKRWDEVRDTTGFASNLVDLSQSFTRRKASPSGIELDAADLAPTPRYETWRLQAFGEGQWQSLVVPADDVAPATDARLDVEAADGLFLADTCGHVTRAGAHLAGSCRVALPSLSLHGGRLDTLPDAPTSLAAVAVVRGHARAMQLHLGELAEAGAMAAAAWPGLAVPRLAVVEVPAARDGADFDWSREGVARCDGSVLLVEERRVLAPAPLVMNALATDAVATALLARRPTPSTETRFFRQFYRTVASARIGGGSGDAIMQSDGQPSFRYALKLLEAKRWDQLAWAERLPSLVSALRTRVGEERLVSGIDAFLAGSGTGSARDLFDAIGKTTGVPLAVFYEDFVEGNAVPVLTLENVTFEQSPAGWQVRGFVRNTGSGHVTCPIVVRTDGAPTDASVDVGPDERVPFVLSAHDRPRVALLDPLGDCFRYRPKNGVGLVERVERP